MSSVAGTKQAVTVGGPVLGAFATLRVFSASLDPDEVTTLFKIAPTSSHRTGDRVSPRVAAQRKQGMWLLESVLPRTETLSEHIIHLVALLPNDRSIWDDLHRRHTVDVYCSVDVRVPNSGTELTATAIEALAARGLTIQFDFYALLPEEDGEGEDH